MKSMRNTVIPPEDNRISDQRAESSQYDLTRIVKVLAHQKVAVASFNFKGQCVYCSPFFKELIGAEPKNFSDLTLLLSEDPEERRRIGLAFDSLKKRGIEKQSSIRIIGNRRWESSFLFEIVEIEGDSVDEREYAVLLKDNSDHENFKRDLSQFDRLAALGRVTAGVVHEFNNILTAVLGWAQIAMQNNGSSSVVFSALEIIEGNAKRARQISSRLLGISKNTAQECHSISMSATIEEVLKLMSCDIENEAISVVKSFEDNDICFADENRLSQVFINIIRNAMDAMHGGGTLSISIRKSNNFIKALFKDNGPGMDQFMIERIFEPFFTTKLGNDVQKYGGTGLGLSICRDIIEEIGGNISVESKLGRGTCFTVTVPVVDRISSPPDRFALELPTVVPKISVLVVDDEPDIGEMICTCLKLKEHDAVLATSGAEALDKCSAKKFDTAFVDFSMPGLCGHKLIHEMIAVQPDLKIIAMSGREIEVDESPQIAEFLKKPFDLDDIQLKLAEVLGHRT